jgi:hypothetical protein
MRTYAFGRGKEVSIWARSLGSFKGGFKFEVLNGGWTGTFRREPSTITLHSHEASAYHTELLWEGSVPRPFSDDYNDAINWIEQQLSERTST